MVTCISIHSLQINRNKWPSKHWCQWCHHARHWPVQWEQLTCLSVCSSIQCHLSIEVYKIWGLSRKKYTGVFDSFEVLNFSASFGTQGSPVLSLKLFRWTILEKVTSSNCPVPNRHSSLPFPSPSTFYMLTFLLTLAAACATDINLTSVLMHSTSRELLWYLINTALNLSLTSPVSSSRAKV